MTNGRGARAAVATTTTTTITATTVGMASFMTKKKKYKFQVDVCLEELIEVPFISAVLFAKLRLLDGGSFQDHSSREEVKDHKVGWGAKFTFPCKMMANASTGVLERCVLRISVRKESKGGRSFNKLGFVDLNLAEYAGAGVTYKKALLEGYDARHRQDNSMLKFSIAMNMLSGDVLFKVPSPSLRPKSAPADEPPPEQRSEEYSGGSLAGSIASGSSGFGSLPKKRPALLSSELVIGQTLSENNIPVTVAPDSADPSQNPSEHEEIPLGEPGHSRNSSNTSQLSKASGYSSIHSHSHSRQSSSGDSGHIRNLHSSLRIASLYRSSLSSAKFTRTQSFPTKPSFPRPQTTIPAISTNDNLDDTIPSIELNADDSIYFTPKNSFDKQNSNLSTSSNEEYRTPEDVLDGGRNVFAQQFNELQKSFSTTAVEYRTSRIGRDFGNAPKNWQHSRASFKNNNNMDSIVPSIAVTRSKSDYELSPISSKTSWLTSKIPESLCAFLTPSPKRKNPVHSSTPSALSSNPFKIPLTPSPMSKRPIRSFPDSNRTISLNCLQVGGACAAVEGMTNNGNNCRHSLGVQPVRRQHRKLLLDGASVGGKLAPPAISPDETDGVVQSQQLQQTQQQVECAANQAARRPSVTTNPSSSSLALSETGSLDRAKAAYERRKKNQLLDSDAVPVAGRVENTRVNPDHLIEDLLKNTNLEPADDDVEASGLQLFIAKDGTAALGNHEVKSQMSTGVQSFKQVVMDDNR